MVERGELTSLDGKVAIVSGGTKTSGEAIATELASRGASVVVCGRSTSDGEAVATRIREAGGTASFLAADVGRERDVQAAVDQTVTSLGRLDLVVNNAAALDVVRGGLG